MVNRQLVRMLLRRQILQVDEELRPDPDRWAWENQSFTPPAPTSTDPQALWVQEHLMVSDERRDASEIEKLEGLYQLSIMVAKGAGTKHADQLIEALGDVMPAGYAVQDENLTTQISVYKAVPGQGADGDAEGGVAWWMVPIVFWFRAYTRTS